MSVPISDDNHCTEAKASPAFDDFADTIDMNHFFLELQPFRADAPFESRHVSCSLKLQASFARSFSYGADASMIQEPVPVEHHSVDAFFLTLLGNERAYPLCCFHCCGFPQRRTQLCREGRCRSKSLPTRVGD